MAVHLDLQHLEVVAQDDAIGPWAWTASRSFLAVCRANVAVRSELSKLSVMSGKLSPMSAMSTLDWAEISAEA